MNIKLKKVDVIIIVALIIISILVLYKAKIIDDPRKEAVPEIDFLKDDENNKLIVTYVSTEVRWDEIDISGICDTSNLGTQVIEGDFITDCFGTISVKHKETSTDYGSWTFSEEEILPISIIAPNLRDVSPNDQGSHYNRDILISREWWYYTAIFSENSALSGWTLSVSFNHMARNDLTYKKPDLLIVTLHSPDGEEHGGIIERERPLLGDYAFLKEPSLQVSSSDTNVIISFEDSYVQGLSPNWFLHIEGAFPNNENIKIDLSIKANSAPYWSYSNRPIDKSKGDVASYVFLGCNVEGTINLNGMDFEVKGIGHHEHTWLSGLLSTTLVRGWDWCHMTLENGWNIYYSNYYFTSQFKSSKKYKINPFSNIIITSDKGKTLTILEDIEIDITDSDKLFLLLNIPNKMTVTANPSLSQIVLKDTNINLNLNLNIDNSLSKEWKRLSYVGMKIGRTNIDGSISWTDKSGDHNIDLLGIGSIWHMRH